MLRPQPRSTLFPYTTLFRSIPRGVHEGQRIRLRGQGEAGARGGKSGDLFLRVRLARHPDFTVEGSDLIHEVKIEPWQRSEEHTSELQSHSDLVCRLLLEKKN